MTQVPISHDLIARLRAEFPGIFVGIKDSAGDIENMKKDGEKIPDFSVLAEQIRYCCRYCSGGAGCITATSNCGQIALDLSGIILKIHLSS